MAKFTPGPIVAEIRNALGAQVFSRNQHGAYTRARTAPDNTPTPARIITKARFAAAAFSWNDDLTDVQRLSWMRYADALSTRSGPINGRKLTGQSAFASSFANLSNISVAPLLNPPNKPLAGQIQNLSLTVDADTQTLELDGTIPPGAPSQGIIILATPPLAAARYYGWNLARQIAAFGPGWTFPLQLWDEYTQILDTPGAPLVVILYAIPVAALSGLAGTRQSIRAVATGEGSPMLFKTTVLTDAQIKALPVTPASIVPAVAAKVIVPFLTVLQLNATAGAYANISPGAVNSFRTVMVSGKSITIRNDVFLAAAAKALAILPPRATQDAIPPTVTGLVTTTDTPLALTNVPLTLSAVNALGAFTGGNAANTLTVTTYYQLLDPV